MSVAIYLHSILFSLDSEYTYLYQLRTHTFVIILLSPSQIHTKIHTVLTLRTKDSFLDSSLQQCCMKNRFSM